MKVIKISLNGGQGEWLDPTTLAVMFTINNSGPTGGGGAPMLHFLSGPWTLFRRMRVICGGAIIEDVDNYSRCHELFHMLGATAKRHNDDILGFNTATYDDLYDVKNHYPLSRDWYK